MASDDSLAYKPAQTIDAFIQDYRKGALFYDWIVGALGSGKTTGLFFKLIYMAKLQQPQKDGVRRSRAVVVRSTMPQLKDTTIKSWDYWFKDGQAGTWKATEKIFILRFDDVECEVLFRALDTADDIARVLSLEITFAIIDEFVQIPREIIDALSGRLGRYPAAKDGGATNWGMWGSSNPDTEDNWWFDYLHDEKVVEPVRLRRGWTSAAQKTADELLNDKRNVRYFHQPSGFAEDAENLENLPGGREYYTNQALGKSEAWVKQFLDAEWGFSASGRPVIGTFRPDLHISKKPLIYQPTYPLVAGFDPGLAGTAMVFGQEDLYGRLLILGELMAVGVGATRFITDFLKPYLRRRFPNAQLIIAPDPAAANRAQTDETPVVAIFKKHFGSENVKIETNNRLPLRIDAIESYTTRLTDMGPALLIDEQACPKVCRALRGGWRFAEMARGAGEKPVPEKNASSHPGDATGYLARYFHKQFERGMPRGMTVKDRPMLPQGANPHYHIR